MTSVGAFIVDTLAAHGVRRVYLVPGESYLGLLDALYEHPSIDVVVCRHESGAGFMALAEARLTGTIGVVCVSRGPGASNAAIALHAAEQDGLPVLLIVGQVAAQDLRRDAFQEIDYRQMFGGIAKHVAEIGTPAKAPEMLLRAIQACTCGEPGPVVLAVPEDVLQAPSDMPALVPQARPRAAPFPDDVRQLARWLEKAERPLVIAGAHLRAEDGRQRLLDFIEAWNLPTVVSFRDHDLLSNDHPLYVGDLGLANPDPQRALLARADLLLVLGARLADITTQGYSFPRLVGPQMRLVHVHPDPARIGTHFATDLAIACDPRALIDALGSPERAPRLRTQWRERLATERGRVRAGQSPSRDEVVAFTKVVERVGASLTADEIVTVDAGSFAEPIYRIIPFAPPQRLIASASGAMGCGIPAAISAALSAPERRVTCFVGDGGLLMTGGELAVAQERGLRLKLIVSENRSYGSIRIHQDRHYPGRRVGTVFANPDLEEFGRAFGFETTRIRSIRELDRLPGLMARPTSDFIIVDTAETEAAGRAVGPT